ncbi:hypothetical protein [Lentzea tibetensis]|nr:hypothetical protein [Lentzea tibetensis]
MFSLTPMLAFTTASSANTLVSSHQGRAAWSRGEVMPPGVPTPGGI